MTEELLDLQSLKDQTRGTDLLASVCSAVDDMNYHGVKLVGLSQMVNRVDYQH